MISVKHRGPASLQLGIVRAQQLPSDAYPPSFEEMMQEVLNRRANELDAEEDEWRRSVRDILRNGSYKPTGRGKPASEYLIRAATEHSFPRINSFVDICNYISLWSLLPISIWDLDRAGSAEYEIRLGTPDEAYMFNSAGHEISLNDLVVGCAVDEANPDGRPVVNPVKDSMATKTTNRTARVGAIIYSPLGSGPAGSLQQVCDRFSALLAATAAGASAVSTTLEAGDRVKI